MIEIDGKKYKEKEFQKLHDLNVKGDINLTGYTNLTSLPDNLKVYGPLDLTGCTSLKSLPDNFNIKEYLNLNECTNLRYIKKELKKQVVGLSLKELNLIIKKNKISHNLLN